jgi:hypothetical protein
VANCNGDDRAKFVITNFVQQFHHRYLRHLGYTMGALSNVLNVVSKEVSNDTNHVPSGFAQTKRKHGSPRSPEEEVEKRSTKLVFRDGIADILKGLGVGISP